MRARSIAMLRFFHRVLRRLDRRSLALSAGLAGLFVCQAMISFLLPNRSIPIIGGIAFLTAVVTWFAFITWSADLLSTEDDALTIARRLPDVLTRVIGLALRALWHTGVGVALLGILTLGINWNGFLVSVLGLWLIAILMVAVRGPRIAPALILAVRSNITPHAAIARSRELTKGHWTDAAFAFAAVIGLTILTLNALKFLLPPMPLTTAIVPMIITMVSHIILVATAAELTDTLSRAK